jgi:hypothetical protein
MYLKINLFLGVPYKVKKNDMCRSCVCFSICLPVITSEVRKPQGKRLFEGSRCRTECKIKTDLREIQ